MSDSAKSFFVINEDRIFVSAFPLFFHSAFVKQRRFLVPFPLRKLNCSPIFGEFMLLTRHYRRLSWWCGSHDWSIDSCCKVLSPFFGSVIKMDSHLSRDFISLHVSSMPKSSHASIISLPPALSFFIWVNAFLQIAEGAHLGVLLIGLIQVPSILFCHH